MAEYETIYLDKAREALEGAGTAYENGRYNNCANKCYYSCFAAAVHALAGLGIIASGARRTWSHEALQAAFARELIARRKIYPTGLGSVLLRNRELRLTADYETRVVTQAQASHALSRSRQFVEAVSREAGRR